MVTQTTETARFNMIEQQIRPWQVMDQRVLNIMQAVPRENFVPLAYKGLAFADTEIPLGNNRYMASPKIQARMLQALNIQPHDKVLEVGTGSGFLTACLAQLGGKVVSIDIDPGLVEQARGHLDQLHIQNVELQVADALASPAQGGPFDVIAVAGALPSVELLQGFIDQLNEGGRLFAVVGQSPVMEALLITRLGERDIRREGLFETTLHPLNNAIAPKSFVF